MKYLIITLLLLSCKDGSSQPIDSTAAQMLDLSIIQQIVDKIRSDGKTDGATIEISETKEYFTLSSKYDWSLTSMGLSKLKSDHIFGNLGNDGIEDAIINVNAY